MSAQVDRNEFNSNAMLHGTMLGVMWIIASVLYLLGLGNPIIMLLFFVVALSTPFFAGRWAVKYRKNECNNTMNFIQAFMYMLIMFTCASLLTSVAHYIYFKFIDGGYIVQLINESIDIALENSAILPASNIEILETTKNILGKVTPMDWTLSFLSTNIMIGAVLVPIIALLVKNNPEK